MTSAKLLSVCVYLNDVVHLVVGLFLLIFLRLPIHVSQFFIPHFRRISSTRAPTTGPARLTHRQTCTHLTNRRTSAYCRRILPAICPAVSWTNHPLPEAPAAPSAPLLTRIRRPPRLALASGSADARHRGALPTP